MTKLNCVFFATPDIAIDTLLSLSKNPCINLLLVASMPDRRSGRGKELRSPAIIYKAKELKLPYIQSENFNKSDEFFAWCDNNQVDIVIVFAFAQFLGSTILNLPKFGCFNIHTSILPKYRGAAPMQYALFNGDPSSGISIQKMVKKMDAGNIVGSEKLTIQDSDNLGVLHDKFQTMAPRLAEKLIADLISNSLEEVRQVEADATFAPSIPKSETLLDFINSDSITLHNKVRGLSPIPCAFCFINNKRLKVFKSELSSIQLNPGQVCTQFGTLVIGTNKGSLRLALVQLEGRSKCNDLELINGFKNGKKEIVICSTKDTK